jgi:hypothetical protein
MRSRSILFALLLLLLTSVPARAQEAPSEGPETEIAKQLVQVLKDELELSEDQATKARTAIEESIRESMQKMMKHMAEEEPDQDQMRKEGDEARAAVTAKIKELLDDEQRKEFDVLVKEFDTRAGRFQRGAGNPGGEEELWLEGELASKERLLLKAENVLLLSEDEKKVVLPKVDAVISARERMRDARREQRKSLAQAVHAKAKDDEVRERLHALRNHQVELEKTLAKAEDELRELITVDQEARLVAIGILD